MREKSNIPRPPEHFGYPLWVILLLVGGSVFVALIVFGFHLFDGDSLLFVFALMFIAAGLDVGNLTVDEEGITIRRVVQPWGQRLAWGEIESIESGNAKRTILVTPKRGRCRQVNLSLIGFSPKRDIALVIESWMLMYEHHYCGKCGYPLRGNTSGKCPECGMPVPGSREPAG